MRNGVKPPTQPDVQRLHFPETRMPPHILPIVLLSISNLFMTLAWYGHLKFKAAPLLLVIFVSWGIAFFE